MAERVDVAVIGGGVTGLASALAIAKRGQSVCVLERHSRYGLETSTHNSGVIHAGLYHPPGSLKSGLCVSGRPLLYEFCAGHGVPHKRCGKLVVAVNDSEIPILEALHRRGIANGVEGLELIEPPAIARREPSIRAVAALYSPESGIVNAEALVKALLQAGEAAGVMFLPGTAMTGSDTHAEGMAVHTPRETILARVVVNAAGLYADEVSEQLGGERFTIYPCRGEYAQLIPARRSLINAPVYPVPEPSGHGLGVHLTRSTGGDLWLGPTARFQDRKDDYEANRAPVESFLAPARRLLPSVSLADIRLAGTGIRPKLHPASESFADFLIRRDRRNPSIIQAAGIDSPGLTACLAIGHLVSDLVTS
jgi:L-2-hydroxyglutarate oxidase LhgO